MSGSDSWVRSMMRVSVSDSSSSRKRVRWFTGMWGRRFPGMAGSGEEVIELWIRLAMLDIIVGSRHGWKEVGMSEVGHWRDSRAWYMSGRMESSSSLRRMIS